MAAKGNTFSGDLLKLIFTGQGIANIADNAGTSPLTNLYVSLHTSSPGASGTQTTNEAAYTSYSRVAVTRTSGGWTVTTNSVSPVATIVFPAATGGSETEQFAGVGVSATGAGKLLYFCSLSPTIAVSNGVTPEVLSSSTISET